MLPIIIYSSSIVASLYWYNAYKHIGVKNSDLYFFMVY